MSADLTCLRGGQGGAIIAICAAEDFFITGHYVLGDYISAGIWRWGETLLEQIELTENRSSGTTACSGLRHPTHLDQQRFG